jgi:hypothetical protein
MNPYVQIGHGFRTRQGIRRVREDMIPQCRAIDAFEHDAFSAFKFDHSVDDAGYREIRSNHRA